MLYFKLDNLACILSKFQTNFGNYCILKYKMILQKNISYLYQKHYNLVCFLKMKCYFLCILG